MDSRTVLLLLTLVGCGLCWRKPIDFPGVEDDWPLMPVPGIVDKAVGNSIVCEACTVVIAEVQALLGNDSSQIIKLLDEICAELPPDYNETCKEYVDEWTPIIIDFLENQTPEEICEDLTLCTAADIIQPPRTGFGHLLQYFHRSIKRNFNKLMIRNALGNDFLCDGCNEIVFALHQALTNTQALDEIAALLAEGCAICPVEAQCRDFFQNLPGVIEAFANEYLNNQTCKALGFCQSSGLMTPMDMFSRLFLGVPRGFSGYGRPSSSRPRPNTEPAPRPHPYRENFRTFYKPGRHGSGREDQNDTRPDGREHHEDGRKHHEWHRPGHPRWEGRPHPHGRLDHPHHGPDHGPRPDDMPVPENTRPWWKPNAKPFRPRPSSGKPALPDEPMIPEVEIPEVEIPEVEIPDVQIPDVESPQVPSLNIHPDPRNPYSPNRQDDRARPWGTSPRKPSLENRKGATPVKPWYSKGNRKQRSVRISTVINTNDFDQAHTFDVEPVNEQPVDENVENTWVCDACEDSVGVLQKYLEENKDAVSEELLTIANLFCERLPATSVAECKTEFADLLPSLVDLVIEDYLTPDAVCTALKVC